MEHLLPQSLGGTDDFGDLALACSRCNSRRYNLMTGIDSSDPERSFTF